MRILTEKITPSNGPEPLPGAFKQCITQNLAQLLLQARLAADNASRLAAVDGIGPDNAPHIQELARLVGELGKAVAK